MTTVLVAAAVTLGGQDQLRHSQACTFVREFVKSGRSAEQVSLAERVFYSLLSAAEQAAEKHSIS